MVEGNTPVKEGNALAEEEEEDMDVADIIKDVDEFNHYVEPQPSEKEKVMDIDADVSVLSVSEEQAPALDEAGNPYAEQTEPTDATEGQVETINGEAKETENDKNGQSGELAVMGDAETSQSKQQEEENSDKTNKSNKEKLEQKLETAESEKNDAVEGSEIEMVNDQENKTVNSDDLQITGVEQFSDAKVSYMQN